LNQFATAGKLSCNNRKCALLCGLYFMDILLGQIKSAIFKQKLQTLEAFLNLEYTISLHYLICRKIPATTR
jgi:hypothetical protein